MSTVNSPRMGNFATALNVHIKGVSLCQLSTSKRVKKKDI